MDTNVNPQEYFTTDDFTNDEKKVEKQPQVLKEETENADVIEEYIEPIKSFESYAGKRFDPTQPININNDHEIYENKPKNQLHFESPLQKYQRLQSEMIELTKQFDEILKKKWRQ